MANTLYSLTERLKNLTVICNKHCSKCGEPLFVDDSELDEWLICKNCELAFMPEKEVLNG